MILNQSLIQTYLIGSASGQKAQAKPVGSHRGERCQGVPAMTRREEASRRRLAGSRFGRDSGRVCAPVTKPVSSPPRRSPSLAGAVSHGKAVPVKREIMQEQWHHHPTGELPPRPSAPWRDTVTSGDKAPPKRPDHARVSGTGSLRPRLQGTQQRQSSEGRARLGVHAPHERLNLRVPRGPFRFMGQVSLTAQAPKWPVRTSSGQPVVSYRLRNGPQQPPAEHVSVRLC
jgi:hypothetical protein